MDGLNKEKMEIRKSFKFNGMHIVRNCTSNRCKFSLHAHTYTVELLFSSYGLDNGQMVVDFGIFKGSIKDMIKSFHDSITIWTKENDEFKDEFKKVFPRWVEVPCSPSAESYSILIYKLVDKMIRNTKFNNNEIIPRLVGVRVHETRSGYAEYRAGIGNSSKIYNIDKIKFSKAVKQEWLDSKMFKKLKKIDDFTDVIEKVFINPTPEQQIDEKAKVRFSS